MHIGHLIQQKVSENGMTVVAFARKLSCTRVNAYKLFSRSSIDTETLMRISLILDFDFFKEFSEHLKSASVHEI